MLTFTHLWIFAALPLPWLLRAVWPAPQITTALAFEPRASVATHVGGAWADWLDLRAAQPMSQEVRQCLTVGVYQVPAQSDVELLRAYAAAWIAHHRVWVVVGGASAPILVAGYSTGIGAEAPPTTAIGAEAPPTVGSHR